MKSPGLLGMIQLVGSLVFAIPVAIVGIEFVSSGRTILGAAFFGLAVLMLALPEYVQRRATNPATAIKRRLGGLRPGKRRE